MGCITLTTDFGRDSSYVAVIKGVILSRDSSACIVDISHSISAQNIRQGAIVLAEVYNSFPRGTVHLAVVDPGVGTDRQIIAAEINGHFFVAPDNGLLSAMTRDIVPTSIHTVTNLDLCQKEISSTFQGRDIMAPIAVFLAQGNELEQVGLATPSMNTLDWPEVIITDHQITGEIEIVDSFGNLITNITIKHLKTIAPNEKLTIQCGEHQVCGMSKTYAENRDSALVALWSSNGQLELAIVGGSASQRLGKHAGDEVTLFW